MKTTITSAPPAIWHMFPLAAVDRPRWQQAGLATLASVAVIAFLFVWVTCYVWLWDLGVVMARRHAAQAEYRREHPRPRRRIRIFFFIPF